MPLYQNATVGKEKLVIGNYQMLVGPYGATTVASCTNLGAGIVNSFSHNITKYDVQAGNAPDPIEGIAEETFAVEGELIEYDSSKIALLYSGVATTTGSALTGSISFGGLTQLTDVVIMLQNKRNYTATAGTAISVTTVIRVPKATVNTGLAFTAKSDNDTDPINVLAFSVLGKIDGTLSVGSQLYTITRTTA